MSAGTSDKQRVLKRQRNVRLAQLDRAFGYGPKGRGFESLRAHSLCEYADTMGVYIMVGIAQLVSAPDCGSGGQGFESLYPPFLIHWAIAKR